MATHIVPGAPRAPEGMLARKLAKMVPLPPAAATALAHLEAKRRDVARGAQLAVQGQPHGTIQILLTGSAIRYKLLADGRRQVINFALPGDFIDLRAGLLERAQLSVLTLEPATVAAIEPADLFAVVKAFPILGAAMFWTAAMEQSLLNERIVAIGRKSAYERIAHLFLTLYERMSLIGLARPDGFALPLNQEILADTLGLSIVHVNRTLSRLRAEKRATLKSGQVHIHDFDGLVAVSDFEPGYLSELSISPAARAALTFPGQP